MKRTFKDLWPLFLFIVFVTGWISAAAARGATINIPAGVFPFDGNRFQSGNTYICVPGQTIFRNTSTAPFSYTAQLKGLQNVTIIDATFDGNGVEINNGCKNITLIRPTFKNARRTKDNHQALFLAGWSDGIKLQGARWENCSQAAQIYGCTNVLIEDFRVDRCGYGIKWGTNGAANIYIRRGVFDSIRDMGLEIQNDEAAQKNLTVEDLAFVNPELYADDSRNKNSMAYSIPTWRMSGILVNRCFADGEAWVLDDAGNRTGEKRKSSRQWLGLRVGGEIGGARPTWTNCWFKNLNDPGAITSSTEAQVINNLVQDCVETIGFASPANGLDAAKKNSKLERNDANVILPAAGGWTLVGVVPPGASLPQGNPPAPVPVNLQLYFRVDYIDGKITVTPIPTPATGGTLPPTL